MYHEYWFFQTIHPYKVLHTGLLTMKSTIFLKFTFINSCNLIAFFNKLWSLSVKNYCLSVKNYFKGTKQHLRVLSRHFCGNPAYTYTVRYVYVHWTNMCIVLKCMVLNVKTIYIKYRLIWIYQIHMARKVWKDEGVPLYLFQIRKWHLWVKIQEGWIIFSLLLNPWSKLRGCRGRISGDNIL